MHLQEHSMSSIRDRGKAIFPMPLAGQTLMFSPTSCQSTKCDQTGGATHHTPISPKPPKSRCSCEASSTSLSSYSRLLLPAISQKDNSTVIGNSFTDAWLRLPAIGRSNYESFLLNGLPLYGRLNGESFPSLDYALLSNARRKNATRETTSTLKAWLNDHKKNPYPTKSEKIMLAIVTKMTLTQVSTWFANARRRLKKENKMTWLPKKKSGEKKDKTNSNSYESDSDDDDEEDDDEMDVDITSDICPPVKIDLGGNLKVENRDSVKDNDKPDNKIQRPSVIRTIESPTFNEIRDRFKDDDSPVYNLQNWVNGCFQEKLCNNAISDFPKELTPPSTPIENKITTFSSQRLFEAYDANKVKNSDEAMKSAPKTPSTFSDEALEVIFSSKQPVFSVKENTVNKVSESTSTTAPPSGVITPQPSPKNTSEFFKKVSSNQQTANSPILLERNQIKNSELDKNDIIESNNNVPDKIEKEAAPDLRVQGLTTSRELEAVLALTTLHKT